MHINSAEYNLLAANMSCQWVICISWHEILRPCSEGTCNFVIISKWDNTITGFHSTQSQSALTIWAAHIFHSSKDISAARQQHSKALCFHVLKSSTGFVSNLAPPLKTMTLLRLVYMVKYTFLRHYKRVTLERAGQTPAKYQNNIINIEYFVEVIYQTSINSQQVIEVSAQSITMVDLTLMALHQDSIKMHKLLWR